MANLPDGGGGGSGGSNEAAGLILPALANIRETFREAFDWQDYTRAGAGGLVAWTALAQDTVSATVGTYSLGIASVIAGVAKANGIVLTGIGSFLAALVTASTPTGVLIAAFSAASAEIRAAGLLGFVLAIAEVVLLLWIAQKGWEVARS